MSDSARITLTEIIKEHGHGICTQPQRLKGLLLDLCGEHRREVNTLIMALSEGVVERLLQMRDAAPQVVVPSLARRLQEDLGLTAEAARWATESWGLALGVVQRPTSPGPKPVTDLNIGEAISTQPRQLTATMAGNQSKPVATSQHFQHRKAVGIHLGGNFASISWLNEHSQPVTIPNQEGALSTPTAVYFDGDRPIVGVEAIQQAISCPDRVVQHAKRYMGNGQKFWTIDNKRYSPIHISGLILRKLIADAQGQIGKIREAVITVPTQFSDAQRHATMLAGHAAGLERVEMINEPVAAALCHVLGNEGIAFTELAIDQQILVYTLGDGTLDLAIVKYKRSEVRVVASDGDLELGALDFTKVLVDAAAEKFIADFREDPRSNRKSLQFLTLEAEQAKRNLSVRPRAALTVQHEGHRKTYQIEQTEFEWLSRKLIQRSEEITRRILKDNKFGWAHIDVVLTTGGASRMPMIKESLKKLSGRKLNSSLSSDESIANGAAYFAGMLLRRQ